MFVRVLESVISNDLTYKFSFCRSFRCPFSGRPKYESIYLGSLRRSRLFSDVYRRVFFTKMFERLENAGLKRTSDLAMLARIATLAKLEKLQLATQETNRSAAFPRSAA